MRQFFFRILARFDSGCASVSHTSSVALDRPLSLKERMELHLHLLMCGFCRRYRRQLIIIQKLSTRMSLDDNSDQLIFPGLNEEARERIRRAIDPNAGL